MVNSIIGLFEFQNNDMIFACDLHGSLNPEDDVVQNWVVDGYIYLHLTVFLHAKEY